MLARKASLLSKLQASERACLKRKSGRDLRNLKGAHSHSCTALTLMRAPVHRLEKGTGKEHTSVVLAWC